MYKPKYTNRGKQSARILESLLLFVFLFVSAFGVFSYTRVMTPTRVEAAPSSTLNFQARLYTSSGDIVADGNYHIEFKIYGSEAAGASTQGICVGGGTDDCLWMETRTTGNLVQVKNGYFSVNLGDVQNFPNINWDQDLYLTMNIGGSGGGAVWDGEMSPRIKLTSVPYAFQANTARQLQIEDSGFTGTLGFASPLTDNRTISLPDATGTVILDSTLGNTAFLQGGNEFGELATLGTDDAYGLRFETSDVGRALFDTNNNLFLGNADESGVASSPNNFTIQGTGSSMAGTDGAALTIAGGAGATTGTGSNGGALVLQGGTAGGNGDNDGGNVIIQGGAPVNGGNYGDVVLQENGGRVGIGTATLTDTLTIDGTTYISEKLAIGSDATTGMFTPSGSTGDYSALLAVNQTVTNFTDAHAVGSYTGLNFNPDSDHSGLHFAYGQISRVTTESGNANDIGGLLGVSSVVGHRGSGQLAQAFGGQFAVLNSGDGDIPLAGALWGYYMQNGTGTTTNAGGISSSVQAGNGTIINAFGGHLTVADIGGTIVNATGLGVDLVLANATEKNIGIRISDVSNTGSVGNANLVLGSSDPTGSATYSIYSSSIYDSYFAGNIGIGTVAPDARLDVLDDTNPQIRLTHTDDTVYSELQTNSSGNLIITNTGDDVDIQANLIADALTLDTGGLTISGAVTDITTGENEDLTIEADGDGEIILDDIVQIGTLVSGAADDTLLCRNSSNQITDCGNETLQGYVTLQNAYDNGNTVTTTDGTDILFTLIDDTSDPNFLINIASGSSSRFAVQSNSSDILAVDATSVSMTQPLTVATQIVTNQAAGVTQNITVSNTAGGASHYGNKLTVTSDGSTASTIYGQHISFADATSTANTFYGLYIDSTTTNTNDTTYAAAFLGNVGIGTATPSHRLEVSGGQLYVEQNNAQGTQGIIVANRTSGSSSILFEGRFNGTRVFDVSASGHVQTTASYQFFGSNSTGIFNPTTNVLTFRTNNAERVRVDAAGNVGIGTSGPGTALEVNSATGENLRLTYNDNDGSADNYADFLMGNNGSLTIQSNGSDPDIKLRTENFDNAFYIDDSSDAVGIGTDTPLASTLHIVQANANPTTLRLSNGTGTTTITSSNEAATQFTNLALVAENILLTPASGNVGINTNAPDAKLDILDASNPQLRLTHTDDSIYAELQTDSDGNLIITATGNDVDIQADLIADSLTLDTGDITLRNGETIENGTDGTIDITAGITAISGDLQVNGSHIGIAADTDLLQLANNQLTVNGSGTITGDFTVQGATITLSNGAKNIALHNSVDAFNIDSGTLSIDALNDRIGVGDVSPDFRFEIQGSSGNGYFALTNSTDGDILNVNSTGTVRIANANGTIDVNGGDAKLYVVGGTQFEGITRVGNDTNYAEFNASGQLRFTGNARNSRQVMLSPEFPGATLTGDGTGSNVGIMTSDFCSNTSPAINTGVCAASGERHNYYNWTAAANNDYSIFVKWKVPSDFHAFDGTTPIQFYGSRSSGSNSVTLTLRDASTGAACGSATAISNTTSWTITDYNESGCSLTRNQEMIWQIDLSVGVNDGSARIGEIYFNYLADF